MKKQLLLLAALATFASCQFDDSEIWDSIEDLEERVDDIEQAIEDANSDIAALQTLVDALQNNITISSIEETETGYTITLSNGETLTITNGKDGSDAPEVSVKQDTDGIYYWTIGGEWLLDESGNKIKAEGSDGADAVAPEVRINETTGEWEISTDGGETWTSTGVAATASGSSLFTSVDTSVEGYVTFTLSDGTQFTLATTIELLFTIEGIKTENLFIYSEVKEYNVTAVGVADFTISKPDGWRASYANDILTITAPSQDNVYAELVGEVAVIVSAENGATKIVKFSVEASEFSYKLRVLTFEDEDYTAGTNYIGGNDWTSLIDSPEYGGTLLYGTSGMGAGTQYIWADTNNTFLGSQVNGGVDYSGTYDVAYCLWNGGQVISNYQEMDLSVGDYTRQLSVYYTDEVTGKGGYNGSTNFAINTGYDDFSGWAMGSLPVLTFTDGEERIIDHMYVCNTTYFVSAATSGNGLSAAVGEDDWVNILATGYDANGVATGTTAEFQLADGDGCREGWNKFDLSVLGAVNSVSFNIVGTSDNGAGFSVPAYFAYDNVAVRF